MRCLPYIDKTYFDAILNPMKKLKELQTVLGREIQDLYDAEKQLVKALPKMANAATDQPLKDGFEEHLEQTKGHVERLEKVAKILGIAPTGKACKAMKGLVEEGGEIIDEDAASSGKDLALIAAAQKVEHHEIAGYGSAIALADKLDLDDVSDLLKETLDEESATNKALTKIAKSILSDISE